jgi:hypothetical protein
MTPAEVVAYIMSYNERYKAEVKEKITIAYITASLARAKKMPALKKLLKGIEGEEKRKEMTAEEMFKTIRMLNKALGGEEVRKNGSSKELDG